MLDFLIVEGYQTAAEEFVRESGVLDDDGERGRSQDGGDEAMEDGAQERSPRRRLDLEGIQVSLQSEGRRSDRAQQLFGFFPSGSTSVVGRRCGVRTEMLTFMSFFSPSAGAHVDPESHRVGTSRGGHPTSQRARSRGSFLSHLLLSSPVPPSSPESRVYLIIAIPIPTSTSSSFTLPARVSPRRPPPPSCRLLSSRPPHHLPQK